MDPPRRDGLGDARMHGALGQANMDKTRRAGPSDGLHGPGSSARRGGMHPHGVVTMGTLAGVVRSGDVMQSKPTKSRKGPVTQLTW